MAVTAWWATWPAEPVNRVVVSDRLFALLPEAVADAPAGTVVFPPAQQREFQDLAKRADLKTDERAVRALLPVSSEAYRAATDCETNGMPERAIRLLGEAVRRFHDNAPLAVRHVALLVQLGRCVDAQTAGRGAAGRFSGDAAVHAFYGLAAACAGDFPVAREAFERSLALDPNQPAIRQALDALPGT